MCLLYLVCDNLFIIYIFSTDCEDNPIYHCSSHANNTNAGLTCTTSHGITRNQIEFYQNDNELDKVTVSSVDEGQAGEISKNFYYELPPGNERLSDTYNCCTSSQGCPRYCISCIVQGIVQIRGIAHIVPVNGWIPYVLKWIYQFMFFFTKYNSLKPKHTCMCVFLHFCTNPSTTPWKLLLCIRRQI